MSDATPLQQALAAVRDLKARLAAAERRGRDPIAVIGAACRLPGGVTSPDALWELLREGRVAVGPVPADRWRATAWTPDVAGFLDDVARFDADALGIAPREARAMDPQQRLLLETAWQALEDAGMPPDRQTHRRIGVWAAAGLPDYGRAAFWSDAELDAWSGTGVLPSVAAGRIAYQLGLRGPAMTVDTACSSALVAVHLACASLRLGECDAAVVGGVNLLLHPQPSAYFAALQALAPDGRCRPFDAAASGYGRGEAVAVVVLKRLSDVAPHDRVLAVLRGSAVNHDGRSNGLTAPSAAAQEAVIREALANAGAEPADVGYVETHGTGTPLGDPIEADALGATYGHGPILGASKGNLGHTEAAAGLVGLLAAIGAVNAGTSAPMPWLEARNPRLPATARVSAEPTPFGGLAAVSSFGLSGTNAHLVLERGRPPTQSSGDVAEASPGPVLHAVSAADPDALARRVAALEPGSDAAFSEHTGRATWPWRVAGTSVAGRAPVKATPGRVAFLFTGQGAQSPGMGRGLEGEPAYRAALDEVEALFAELRPQRLRDVMATDAVHDTTWTQPALFAVEWALAALWRSWGVEPDVVLGHSIGELTAAAVAGAISLRDAVALVDARSALMGALPRGGGMAAVRASEGVVAAAIAGTSVAIAAVNADNEVVVSGDGVDAVVARLAVDGVVAIPLVVSHAFHSPRMEPMLAALQERIAGIPFTRPRIPVISNVTGAPIEAFDAAYWSRHVRGTVRFADGLRAARALGARTFVELGPHPVLCGLGRRTLPDAAFAETLSRGTDDVTAVLDGLGAAWEHGVNVDWDAFHRTRPGRRVALPPYPFGGERYWLDLPDAATALPPLYTVALEPAPPPTPGDGPPPAVLTIDDWAAVRDGSPVISRDPALVALARVVATESPDRVSSRILLRDGVDAPVGAWPGDVVADARGVWVPRLRRITGGPAPTIDGDVLITGGRGGLGRLLAGWALDRGASGVTLVGRTPAPPSDDPRVTHVTGDVTDEAWLRSLVFGRRWAGIVHAAGVMAPALARDLDDATLRRVLAPKAAAAALAEADAGFVLLLSSAAVPLGSAGQAAYAAANARLDALAGGRVTVLALPPVQGTGMAAGADARRFAADGLTPISPAAFLATVDAALGADASYVAALPVDPSALAGRDPRAFPLLAALIPAAPVTASLDPREVRVRVVEAANAVLGRTGELPADRGFFELGMDSVMAVELADRLRRSLGRPVAATVAFDHPTVDDLVAALGGATRTEARRVAADEPIAVVGLACRFPGAPTPAALWELLLTGKTTTAPITRWDADSYYGPRGEPGRSTTRHAAMLDDVAGFDPVFFGISPAEARRLDPQQRLVLEVSWEALAAANLDPAALKDTETGVFVGIGRSEYRERFVPSAATEPDPWSGTGNESSFAAGRVAYLLGLHGPALAIDTACSSALVAVHLAAEQLRAGACDRALAGGVHLLLSPESFVALSQLDALAPDGRCKTFDAAADGYGRGEGCGMLVLRRLSDAERDGDPVLAVLRGSAVNHDGRSAGLTVPNGAAQRALLRRALAAAGATPEDVGYVEAHGTGTPLGDPIEAGALADVYGRDNRLLLGAIKANVGHTEAASGAAGLIKAILAVRHGIVPPQPGFSEPNPRIPWDRVAVPTAATPFTGLAGVSAFGLSGVNAHVLVGPGPAPAPTGTVTFDRVSCWVPAPYEAPRVDGIGWRVVWEPAPIETDAPAVWAVLGGSDLAWDVAEQLEAIRGVVAPMATAVADFRGLDDPDDLAAHLETARDLDGRRLWLVGGPGRDGLARALARENLDVRWLDPSDDPALVARVLRSNLEDVRLDPDPRVPRLVPSPLGPVRRVEHAVVVSGGFGALGRAIAVKLAALGARLVLVGRNPIPLDVPHTAIAGDIADLDVARRAVEAAGDGPIGVVHAAGVLRDALVADVGDPTDVWRPKVGGARALDAAVRGREVPFFVVFSSLAATLGNAGQSAYAAANAAMEAVVRDRRARGETGAAIAWGPWAAGMADGIALPAGLRALSVTRAVEAFAAALHGGDVVIADLDPGRLRAPVVPAGGSVGERVEAAVRGVLEWPADAPLDPDRGLFDLGMDSLGAVRLATALSAALDRPVPATVPFQHGSVAALIAWASGGVAAPVAPTAAATAEPIAIVGMACRLPGADSPEALWDALLAGTDAIGPVPRDRWDADALYAAVPTPGRSSTRAGGFLADVRSFDAAFFGISPREAARLDPQQRLLLEVAHEALERSGTAPHAVRGTRTGVFVGIGASDYALRFDALREDALDTYTGTGTDSAFAAGRLAYVLGTQGPALVTSTACSSSLVSVHLAARALRAGECDRALAGGVHLMLAPDTHVRLSQLGALSPDGRCKPFDAAADGYGRGEGCAMVVLRRLSDAVRDGEPVLAVVLGSAVNHDGPSSGLTVPNGSAQEAVVRDALADAGVDPGDVGYVQAHGTGTPLGDPIEVAALGAVLGRRALPVRLRSIKANIGHLEAAAGVAGLVEAVLALQARTVPPCAHLRELNPKIARDWPFEIPTAAVPWQGPAIAGVSAFGLSGTNAHVVLGAGPEPAWDAVDDAPQVVPLSAKTPEALDALIAAVAAVDPEIPLGDLARTLAVGRTHHRFRAAAVAASTEVLKARLAAGDLRRGEGTGRPWRPTRDPVALVDQYVGGAEVDWPRVHARRRPVANAPTTRFQRRVHWEEPAPPEPVVEGPAGKALGIVLDAARTEAVRDHVVDGRHVVAGTHHLLLAARLSGLPVTLRDVVVAAPLVVDGTRPAHVQLGRDGAFAISAGPAWETYATGTAGPADGIPPAPHVHGDPRPGADLYRLHADFGYGPSFRALDTVWTGDDGGATVRGSALTPGLLDAGLQAAAAAVDGVWLPFAFGAVTLLRPPGAGVRTAHRVRRTAEVLHADVWFLDEAGAFAHLAGAQLRSVTRPAVTALAVRWEPIAVEAGPVAGRVRLVGGPLIAANALALFAAELVRRGALAGPDVDGDVLVDLRGLEGADPVEATKRALAFVQQAARPIVIVTRGGAPVVGPEVTVDGAAVRGLLETVRHEHPELRARFVDLDPAATPEEDAVDLARALSVDEPRLAFRGGQAHVARLAPVPASGPVRVDRPASKVLADLRAEPFEPPSPGPAQVRIRVVAAGVNFRDVLGVLGTYPGDPGPLGSEVAGIVDAVGTDVADLRPGDAVFGLAGPAFATHAVTDRRLVARLPRGVDLVHAATLPIAYLTVWYGLVERTLVEPGNKVLIHAAAGGVGQAAIQLCQWAGAEIHATAHPSKWPALRAQGVQHLYSSRDLDFAPRVRGRMDVVIGAVAGEQVDASVAALKEGGRYVEIGKRGWSAERMAAERPDVQLVAFDLGEIAQRAPTVIAHLLHSLVGAVEAGHVGPLRARLFALDRAADALSFMAASRHVGKVVLVPDPAPWADPGTGAVVITGGLGGLGRAVARHLVARGEKRLVLVGRTPPSAEARAELAALRASGARVDVALGDVASDADLGQILADVPGPIGVIHAAGVLRDAPVGRLGGGDVAAVFAPKLAGLDKRLAGRSLRFLALFSSAAGVVGSPGQAAYGAANAAMEAVAWRRRARGLPAVAIAWGPWGEVGMAAHVRGYASGVRHLAPSAALEALDAALAGGWPAPVIVDADWDALPGGDPLFAGLRTRAAPVVAEAAAVSYERAPAAGMRERLAAVTVSERRPLVIDHVRQVAGRTLGFDRPVDPRAPLRELGLDSMAAVELRNTLGRDFCVSLPATVVFDHPTAEALAERVLGELAPKTPPPAPPRPAPRPAAKVDVADLSDDEIAALLRARDDK